MSTTASLELTSTEITRNPEVSVWCPKCGARVPQTQLPSLGDAQARISELKSQIKVLTLRATSAVERANEYEASLRHLNAAKRKPVASAEREPGTSVQSPPSNVALNSPDSNTPTQPAPIRSQFARLLTRSASSASAPPSTAPLNRPGNLAPLHTPMPQVAYPATAGLPQSEMSLLDALTQEQALRRAAENAAAQTNSEIEELTGQLFEQANEMVAAERKARARLEERVELLERRDGEKTKRLSVLERRVLRVERVRNLLEKEKEIEMEKTKSIGNKGPDNLTRDLQKEQSHGFI